MTYIRRTDNKQRYITYYYRICVSGALN